MSTIELPKELSGIKVAKRAMFLAYESAYPVGMGFLQAREGLKEEDIYKATEQHRPGALYGDYVYGRMMKLGIEFTFSSVTIQGPFISDYQSFSGKYTNPEDLINAAIMQLIDEMEK